MSEARLTVWVSGRVQGVGMRWWIRSRALELGLAGWARNTEDGRVEVVAEGERVAAEALLGLLRDVSGGLGRPGRIDSVVERWSAPVAAPLSGFVER
ncbi:MAG: acylphosphatase [Frankiaceae bacterium]|nr:acylphosphatase [Frankiaceae bacterium]